MSTVGQARVSSGRGATFRPAGHRFCTKFDSRMNQMNSSAAYMPTPSTASSVVSKSIVEVRRQYM